MKQALVAAALAHALATPLCAGMREARDAFARRDFAAAHAELRDPARSGNAEAEAMLGTLYLLGLGTDRDPARAFDWTLRAAGRGLPSAQARLAHLYETGAGLPAPDRMRAYVWYSLAAIGGAADAAHDRDRLQRALTADQRRRAAALIEDYRQLLFPIP